MSSVHNRRRQQPGAHPRAGRASRSAAVRRSGRPVEVAPAHFVLTRFNARPPYLDRYGGLDEAWLRHRFELFERFTLPSMATAREHTWLVFFDAGLGDPFRRRLREYRSVAAGFTPVFVDGILTDPGIAEHVRRRLPPDASHLITTRLDNDDAVQLRFVDRVQSAFRPVDDELLNFPVGYQYHAGRLYWWLDLANPFISLVEAVDRSREITSVFCDLSHRDLGKRAPIRQVITRPMWMQVIHGGNIANELRGLRRPVARPPRTFADEPPIPAARDHPLAVARDVLGSSRRIAEIAARHSILRRRSRGPA